MTTMIMALLNIRASIDTQQRLPYTPHRTAPTSKTPKTPLTLTPTSTLPSVSHLLTRNYQTHHYNHQPAKPQESTYMGYDTWLPNPPKVEKPRSIYNAASLAFIGDCIYELYARRHFLFPPLSIEEYNDRVMAVVRCEAQDAMLQKLINDNYLSKEERILGMPKLYRVKGLNSCTCFPINKYWTQKFKRNGCSKLQASFSPYRDILRWGKNIGSAAKTRTKKRAGVAVYNRASSLETLVGHLYLTNPKRLEEVMLKLGFSADGPSKLISDKANIPLSSQ